VTVAAVRRPLIEKVPRVDSSFRDAVIARVENVKHIGTKLETHIFADSGVFDNTE
jgi:hypothetical protein